MEEAINNCIFIDQRILLMKAEDGHNLLNSNVLKEEVFRKKIFVKWKQIVIII